MSPPFFPEQQRAVDAIRDAAPGDVLVLRAPTGSGRSRTAARGAAAFIRERSTFAIVLAPAALVEQWMMMFEDLGIPVTGIRSARDVRLQELQDGPDPWRVNAAVVLSVDFTKNHEIAASLAERHAGLIIIDEPVRLVGRRLQFYRLLRDRSPDAVILGLTSGIEEFTLETGASQIGWSTLTDELGRRLSPVSQVRTVEFRRTSEELELLASVAELLHLVADSSQLQRANIARSAGSSWRALQNSLTSLSSTLSGGNKIASRLPPSEEAGLASDPEPLATSIDVNSIERIDRVIESIDDLSEDSKLSRLVALVAEPATEASPCVLLTSYAATAVYAASAIAALGRRVLTLTGSSSARGRVMELDGADVVVATDAGLRGLEFGATRSIWLDVPTNPVIAERRRAVGSLDRTLRLDILVPTEPLPAFDTPFAFAGEKASHEARLSGQEVDGSRVAFDALGTADLVVGRVYEGGSSGNRGDDPITKLVYVGNTGGIRARGGKSVPGATLVALYTTEDVEDWPDEFDPYTARLVYFGDNDRADVSVEQALEQTGPGGNRLLGQTFEALHDGRRDQIPPFVVFRRLQPAEGRAVEFVGLAAPGGAGLTEHEDLVAVWTTNAEGRRFLNYRATFTVLDAPHLTRSWLERIRDERVWLGGECPDAWKRFVERGEYVPLGPR